MTSYRYIGYGVTNSNGVAHLDHDPQGNSINGYTGTGAGEVDVVASLDNPVVEGSIVSEIYDVCDAVWYDKGILDDPQTNDNWGDYSSFATLTRTLTHSILKETGSTNVIARIYNNGRTYKFNGNYCLELDLKQEDGDFTNAVIDIRDFNGSSHMNYANFNNMGVSDYDWHHIVVKITENTVTFKADNNTPYSIPRTVNADYRLGLWGGGNITELHFKDVRVYPI